MEIIMRICYEPDREETIDRILCNRCKHLRSGITCDAFPDGIPMAILRNGEHFLPVPGDNGIVFEEKETLYEGVDLYHSRVSCERK